MREGAISWDENPNGYWVVCDDAERELAKLRAVVKLLPACSANKCLRPATRHDWDSDGLYCDEHSGRCWDLPYADALRELEKP
jgi:hypothetical protein